jgi:hypothetical protein
MKSRTTTLFQWLTARYDVHRSVQKEPSFFSDYRAWPRLRMVRRALRRWQSRPARRAALGELYRPLCAARRPSERKATCITWSCGSACTANTKSTVASTLRCDAPTHDAPVATARDRGGPPGHHTSISNMCSEAKIGLEIRYHRHRSERHRIHRSFVQCRRTPLWSRARLPGPTCPI